MKNKESNKQNKKKSLILVLLLVHKSKNTYLYFLVPERG